MAASLVFIVGAAIQLVGSVDTMYAGRFLTGLGVGPLTSVVPLYVSEIAPPTFRGRCIGLFEIAYQLGGLLGFWISYGVNLHVPASNPMQWRVPVATQLPLVGVFLLGCVFLPESPRLLVKKGRIDSALAVLARLRGLDPAHGYVQRELANIQAEVQLERSAMGVDAEDSRWAVARKVARDCVRRDIMYRISIGCVTQFIAQMSGINGINYYSPAIFKSLGVVGTSTGLFATGIYGVVKSITAVVALFFLVDRLGRKTLLLSGCAIMTFSLLFVGVYIKVAGPATSTTASSGGPEPQISGGGIAACAFIYLYVVGYVSSFAGIPWILSSEAVPLNVRATSATLGAAMQWLMNLVITKATPFMISSIGWGTFIFFAAWVVVGAVYVWFFVPETKGVPLEHMAAAFGYEDHVEDLAMGGEKGGRDSLAVEEVDKA